MQNSYFDFWTLLAGLGLFMFAMRQLEIALRQLSGHKFQQILGRSTNKPIKSIIVGVTTTTVVQSSSLVGLIVLAFVGAGIIPLVNAIGIVLGSNLGTTFTGWIVATLGFKFNLSSFVFPLLGLAGLGFTLLKGNLKSLSLFFLGLALLLMGLDFMKSSVSVLTTQFDIGILQGYPLIVYLLVGAILTAIIQSSSAVMMLTLSALHAEVIPLAEAAALIIGADFGTTSTVLLGSLQGAASKRRLAMAHVLFNFIVDALAFVALIPLLNLVEYLQISDPLYSLVLFHSLFNLFGLILFIPFLKSFSELLKRWVKSDNNEMELYIQNVPHKITPAALEALAKETRHLIFLVMKLNSRFLNFKLAKPSQKNLLVTIPAELKNISKWDNYIAIKKYEGSIINYALKIKVEENTDKKIGLKPELISHRISDLMKAIRFGIYSAKSLKDIDENIDSFGMQQIKTIDAYIKELTEFTENLYKILGQFLLNGQNKDVINQELQVLREKSEHFHHEFAHKIYQQMNTSRLSSLNLSTLLNVNKEMETSETNLIRAFELIY